MSPTLTDGGPDITTAKLQHLPDLPHQEDDSRMSLGNRKRDTTTKVEASIPENS